MTLDRLVCANCAGPVSEGRCQVCRANRARMEHEGGWSSISPATLVALVVALLAVLLVVEHATRADGTGDGAGPPPSIPDDRRARDA